MGAPEFIRVEAADGVGTVTLDRPPVNVLNIPMLEALHGALESLRGADLAAIVLRGEGRAFCAGVDVADHTPERTGEMIRLFHGVCRGLLSAEAVTVAVVQGAALGGGCELACVCDVVLASEQAKFGQPEVRVGVFPPVAAAAFPARVGPGRAVELVALGETVSASEAERIGLASHVYPGAEFAAAVEGYVERVRRLSRPVVRLAKRATAEGRARVLADLERAERLYLGELMRLGDAREGIAAFLEKRSPSWRHA